MVWNQSCALCVRWQPYFLLVLPTRGVQWLHQIGGSAQKHGIAGSANHHAEHGQPYIGGVCWWLHAVPDAQHVTHGHEEGMGVLHLPAGILCQGIWGQKVNESQIANSFIFNNFSTVHTAKQSKKDLCATWKLPKLASITRNNEDVFFFFYYNYTPRALMSILPPSCFWRPSSPGESPAAWAPWTACSRPSGTARTSSQSG